MPEIIILGGPNGAGKTTAAQYLFQERVGIRQFVNADEIARGLSPYDPESAAVAAGRIMLERMDELLHLGESFVVETTCAGRSNLSFARRVREGGHAVADEVVIRRYWSGLHNVRRFYLAAGGFRDSQR
jgi:predicted ABC-type ATPase